MLPLVLRRRRLPPPTTLPSRRPFVTSRSTRRPDALRVRISYPWRLPPPQPPPPPRRRLGEAHLLLRCGAHAAAGVRQRRLLLRAWLSFEALAAATYLANVDCSFMDNPVDLVAATEPGAMRSPCPAPLLLAGIASAAAVLHRFGRRSPSLLRSGGRIPAGGYYTLGTGDKSSSLFFYWGFSFIL
jgi:hypothetical protein